MANSLCCNTSSQAWLSALFSGSRRGRYVSRAYKSIATYSQQLQFNLPHRTESRGATADIIMQYIITNAGMLQSVSTKLSDDKFVHLADLCHVFTTCCCINLLQQAIEERYLCLQSVRVQ